jgi:predicted kinase
MTKRLILLVGPPGSGKSTRANMLCSIGTSNGKAVYINQDLQKKEHLAIFDAAVASGQNIVVDRMNFNKEQRSRYLGVAKDFGYDTAIHVLHESYVVCVERMAKREGHETIKNEESARRALRTFFTKYERVEDSEADEVKRIWPDGDKPSAIVVDLDGTLANCDHRLHHIKDEGKKDWKAFFEGIPGDAPNQWCVDIVGGLKERHQIVYCSGRSDEYRETSQAWLAKHELWGACKGNLFMRHDGDYRQDYIAKEILLDFEILTRFKPHFMIDDRKQIVDLWRRRGFTCLACDEGDF